MYRPHCASEAPQIVYQGASGATRGIGGGIVSHQKGDGEHMLVNSIDYQMAQHYLKILLRILHGTDDQVEHILDEIRILMEVDFWDGESWTSAEWDEDAEGNVAVSSV